MVFCDGCRKKQGKDLIELIHGAGEPQIFLDYQVADAERALASLSADVRLDLHNTLDTISEDIQLPCAAATVCCISYVGRLTDTRIEARQEIARRIAAGQIAFGALVFARGPHKDAQARNNFVDVGSKAWFNKHLSVVTQGKDAVFVDDSEDHVQSVRCIEGVKSVQIQEHQSLLTILSK